MANNRMRLRCVPCNEDFLLAKYYPKLTNGWFVPVGWDGLELPDGPERDRTRMNAIADKLLALSDFLEKHSFCNNAGGDIHAGNRDFDLTFEIPKQ